MCESGRILPVFPDLIFNLLADFRIEPLELIGLAPFLNLAIDLHVAFLRDFAHLLINLCLKGVCSFLLSMLIYGYFDDVGDFTMTQVIAKTRIHEVSRQVVDHFLGSLLLSSASLRLRAAQVVAA